MYIGGTQVSASIIVRNTLLMFIPFGLKNTSSRCSAHQETLEAFPFCSNYFNSWTVYPISLKQFLCFEIKASAFYEEFC